MKGSTKRICNVASIDFYSIHAMIFNMALPARDRILVVENDPLIADLVGRQALQSAGYQVFPVDDASVAINRAIQLGPDAIIADISLPGLSGKDLLVALSSQGLDIPMIILARKGQEADMIQAFRLGAADILFWPVQEPEVINAVERVLKTIHERKERERLARQLQQANQELQQRVRELTTIFAIGKTVTSTTDQALLFERILEGVARVTQADLAWFLMRPAEGLPFHLMAQRGLPASIAEYIQRPWEDGVSSLVALSGEALSIHGEPVKRFKIASLGQSALIVPVKVQRLVIGLLVVMRKQPLAFGQSEQRLLEALADYASISISNARLFRAVEERACSLERMAVVAQTGEKINREILLSVKNGLLSPAGAALEAIRKLANDPTARWTPTQRQVIAALQDQVQAVNLIAEAIVPQEVSADLSKNVANLSELIQQAADRCQPLARRQDLTLTTHLPSEVVNVAFNSGHLVHVLEGLLHYSIFSGRPGGRVELKLEKTPERLAHVVVSGTAVSLNSLQSASLFEANDLASAQAQPDTGVAISLALVKEIITLNQGKIWSESSPTQGVRLHFTIPATS